MCLEGLLIYDLSKEFCSSTTIRLVRLLGNLLHYVYHICYAQASREIRSSLLIVPKHSYLTYLAHFDRIPTSF